MEIVKISAEKRQATGKKASNHTRKEDLVPAVVYGGSENHHLNVNYNEVRKVIFTPEFNKISLEADGNSIECIIKDVQFHPVTDKITHIDFQELVVDRKIISEVPVKTTGFALGVKAGGKLEVKLRKLTIKSLPKDLRDEFVVDVTALRLGQSVRVRDLNFDGIEFMNSGGNPIVQVTIPRSLRGQGKAVLEAAEAAVAG